MEITRELDKKFLINCYLIYIIHTWSVLSINNIVLVSSTTFQTYDIISCDASCDHGHMPLHYPKEIKLNQEN